MGLERGVGCKRIRAKKGYMHISGDEACERDHLTQMKMITISTGARTPENHFLGRLFDSCG